MQDGSVRYLVYWVTAQGSRGAPLSWSVISELIGRCVLSVLRDPAVPGAAKMQAYVDDPALALRGTAEERRRQVARGILTWCILGVPLALSKDQLGATISCSGATCTVLRGGAVQATILATRLDEQRDIFGQRDKVLTKIRS